MKYDPEKHHRHSIPLKGFDYTQDAYYFVTLVTHERAGLFGEIIQGEMQLNAAGKLIETIWLALPDRFPNLVLGEYGIMPNHFHAILSVGAALVAAQNPRAGTKPYPYFTGECDWDF
jgi:putative transposase